MDRWQCSELHQLAAKLSFKRPIALVHFIYKPWYASYITNDFESALVFLFKMKHLTCCTVVCILVLSSARGAVQAATQTWQTDNCAVKTSFICKKPVGATGPVTPAPTPVVPGYCPTGYTGTGNKCFKVVRPFNGQAVNWTQALDICRSEPGRLADLASINNAEEQGERE